MKLQYKMWVMLLIAAMTAVACTQQGATGNVIEEPIKIGVIAPLTGDAASYGIAAREALDFAAKEINAQDGIMNRQVRLVYEDSTLDNKVAANAMHKLITIDQVSAVIMADGSGPTTAVTPIANQAGMVIVASLASTPELTKAGDYVFRVIPSDAYQGKELAGFANAKGFDTTAILYVNDAYGQGIREVYTQHYDGRVVLTESYDTGDADFRTQLTKIKAKDPDLILLVVRQELPRVLRQIKELHIESELLGSETTRDEEAIRTAGDDAEGLYTTFFGETQDYMHFRENLPRVTGKEPGVLSEYSYDALYVLKEAFEEAGTTEPESVKDQLYETEIFGASGFVSFDENGDVAEKPFDFFQVQEGELVQLP